MASEADGSRRRKKIEGDAIGSKERKQKSNEKNKKRERKEKREGSCAYLRAELG